MTVKKVLTHAATCGDVRRMSLRALALYTSGYGWSGQSNLAQMVRLLWSPSIPQSAGEGADDVESVCLGGVADGRGPGAAVVLDLDPDVVGLD